MIIHACDVCHTPRSADRGWLSLSLDTLDVADVQVIDLCSVQCGYAFFVSEMEFPPDDQMIEETLAEVDAAYLAGDKGVTENPRQLRPTMSLADFAAQSQMGGTDESEAAAQGSDTFRRQV